MICRSTPESCPKDIVTEIVSMCGLAANSTASAERETVLESILVDGRAAVAAGVLETSEGITGDAMTRRAR